MDDDDDDRRATATATRRKATKNKQQPTIWRQIDAEYFAKAKLKQLVQKEALRVRTCGIKRARDSARIGQSEDKSSKSQDVDHL